jgi:redox-regulated HSP33 family molecular chaperone
MYKKIVFSRSNELRRQWALYNAPSTQLHKSLGNNTQPDTAIGGVANGGMLLQRMTSHPSRAGHCLRAV